MCEMNEATLQINEILKLQQNVANVKKIVEHLRALRNLCAKGSEYQCSIAAHIEFNNYLQEILFNEQENNLKLIAWQLVANTIVQNAVAQRLMWQKHGANIAAACIRTPLERLTEIQLMILYNIYQSELNLLTPLQAMQILVAVWQAIVDTKCDINFEFLHIFFESFIVHKGRIFISCYAQLTTAERISLLDYVATYLRHDSPNGALHSFILQYFAKEFKMKSDCILRTVQSSQSIENAKPKEVYALLRVLASASGCDMYAHDFVTDHALFLNVSSLLRALNAVGKETVQNMFTPKTKLDEITPNSKIAYDFEQEVSFELKTLLVRCVANLLYKNKVNQGYCVDTELLPTLLESTNIDGRNPLLKEWSILAIRNACDGCKETQAFIGNLTKQGDVPSDILKELNLKTGSLRIQPNKD